MLFLRAHPTCRETCVVIIITTAVTDSGAATNGHRKGIKGARGQNTRIHQKKFIKTGRAYVMAAGAAAMVTHRG